VFGGPESLTALSAALGNYLRGGKYVVLTNNFAAPEVNPQERLDSDAEAHVQRALLHYIGSSTQRHEAPALGKALANVEAALRQDPTNLDALSVRHFLLEVPVGEEVARAAIGTAPRDWRAWALLSGVLQGTASGVEGHAVLSRAKLLAADDPAVELDGEQRHFH
jgi:hypothetical protein